MPAFEDPSSQISKVSNLKFLTPIVLHNSHDKHYYISLLYRITNPGIHYILCNKLRSMCITEEIPQLIEIMLKDPTRHISHPIYSLLKDKAQKDKHFRISLFLRLKSVLSTVDESIAAFCYFLCCDILETDDFEKRRNLRTLHMRFLYIRKFRKNRKLQKPYSIRHYYRSFTIQKRRKCPTIEGLMLYFAESVLSPFRVPLFDHLNDFSKTFHGKKNFKPLHFKSKSSLFRENCMLLESLAEISLNLKKMPPSLRSKTLRIYLELINREMSGKVINPLYPEQRILKFSLDSAKVLDSAENCPFVVVFECVKYSVALNETRSIEVRKALALVKQLESVSDIDDLGEVEGIKKSIVTAIENILFNTPRRDEQATVIVTQTNMHKNNSRAPINYVSFKNPSVSIVEITETPVNQAQNHTEEFAERRSTDPQMKLDILTTNETFDELVYSNADVGHPSQDPLHPRSSEKQPGSKQPIEMSSVYQDTESFARQTEKSISTIKERIRSTSKYCTLPGWEVSSFIVKSGNVLKHEYLAYQVLTQMKEIFIMESLPIYIRNYKIILISDTAGLVETINDAQSIHRLKFETKFKTLISYFKFLFKDEHFETAKKNFLYSLVGYSLASYVLQIKDRHNGNILIDGFGHIIHVDFGFTFGKHPGIISVENAPFKFSSEYLELVDLEEFSVLFVKGFKALRRHREKLSRLVEIMQDSGYFEKYEFEEFTNRLRLFESERDVDVFCQGLIDRSIKSMRTMFYDQFQYLSNGYL